MKPTKLTLAAQLMAAMILLMASIMKFRSAEVPVEIFTRLGMEPIGRYLIGVIEFTAAMLLLSPFAASGALLAIGVMCGAVIGHMTYLGISVHDDHGRLFCMLIVVLMCSCFVLFKRRRELPILGSSF